MVIPAVPKLYDLHDIEQEQDSQKESCWRSNIDGVTEPEISKQSNDSLQWIFTSEDVWTELRAKIAFQN